jgi:hypothetical protein
MSRLFTAAAVARVTVVRAMVVMVEVVRATVVMVAVVMAAVVMVAVATVSSACSSPASTGAAPTSTAVPSVWPLPADPVAAASQAGLQMLDREMLAVHYHAHVDVIVRGVRIDVPAGVGIDAARKLISPLHTHDATGIVHIESGEDIPFTLGQFFTEWGQPLSQSRVGPVVAANDERVRVYRNGSEVTGEPAAIKLTSHAEIVVWFGPADQKPQVPASYDFPPGT